MMLTSGRAVMILRQFFFSAFKNFFLFGSVLLCYKKQRKKYSRIIRKK